MKKYPNKRKRKYIFSFFDKYAKETKEKDLFSFFDECSDQNAHKKRSKKLIK